MDDQACLCSWRISRVQLHGVIVVAGAAAAAAGAGAAGGDGGGGGGDGGDGGGESRNGIAFSNMTSMGACAYWNMA